MTKKQKKKLAEKLSELLSPADLGEKVIRSGGRRCAVRGTSDYPEYGDLGNARGEHD